MSFEPLRVLAPAKINLGLFVGPTRADGRHELVSVMQSISLADELTLQPAPTGATRDEVVCVPWRAQAGITGENLAALALARFREATGWDGPPVRLLVDKRIPVAAGLGGGSADAAATLRLAHAASGLGDGDLLCVLAEELGADVPAQVAPGRWLATGAGERLEKLPNPVSPFGVLVLPQASGLSTADVYKEADRLELAHDAFFLRGCVKRLRTALELGTALASRGDLMSNDLQAAAISLCPQIEQALEQTTEVGAEVAFVSGSGPTVVGLFARANGLVRAQRAAAGLTDREPPAMTAVPVDASFAAVQRART